MKDTLGDKIFYFINHLVLALSGLVCLFPLLHIISVSLSDSSAIAAGSVSFYPQGLELAAYRQLIDGTNIASAFTNSMLITIVGVVLSMTFTIMAAYPLSRKHFYGRRFFTLAIVFTMLFSGGLIPTFLLVKSLGMVDSYQALWLPGLVSAFNMLILRTFFENSPEEINEAARIDGCGEVRLLIQIMLPLSLPVLATLSLFYAVHYWNMFMSVIIYISSPEKYNLTVLVQQMITADDAMGEAMTLDPAEMMAITPESMKAAAIVILLLPMLVVYPFIQKYFVKGVMIGSIKG